MTEASPISCAGLARRRHFLVEIHDVTMYLDIPSLAPILELMTE